MTQPNLDDRMIEAAFHARAAGTPSDDLRRRISTGVRSTKQQRPLFGLGATMFPAGRGLAWAAILAALTLVLVGTLALAGGWRPPNLLSNVPPSPSQGPTPSPTSPASPGPSSQPSGPTATPGDRTLQARFVTTDGIAVTIDIVDRSGRLIEAVKGEEGLITEPSHADVQFANVPGAPTELRVEWFSPGGCHEHYGMTIDVDVRTITLHTAYVEGGDSIGGNCGVTLRFVSAVVASELRGVLQNTPPVFGAGSLHPNDVARVVATDGLRVRSAPGTGAESARLEPLLPAGVRLRVLEGSVTADGYAWYRVQPCDAQPAYPTGWVAVASRLGEPWVEPATGAPCAAAVPTPIPYLGTIGGLSCPVGDRTGGDIDRLASPTIGVLEALSQDFEGLLPTDAFGTGSYEGRPVVALIRQGQVVFLGSYGNDGHVFQYEACSSAGIRARGQAS